MKAVVINRFGGTDVMEVADIPEPQAGEGEVLVRVRFAGVGPWDSKTRGGVFGEREFPLILGSEGSGIVEEVGPDVAGFSPGDGVLFTGAPGYAEYTVVAAGSIGKKPEGLSFEEAAALPVAGGTAYEGIFERLELKEGETVLIPGAAGGVGHIAVQMAHLIGATVVATASVRNHDFLKSLGADFTLDYNEGDWVEAVRGISPDGVDAVFDCVGGETFHRSFDATRDGGRVVSIVAFGEESDAGRDIEYGAFSAGVDDIKLAWLAEHVANRELKVEVQDVLPLEDAAESHRVSEEGHVRGKLLLKIGE